MDHRHIIGIIASPAGLMIGYAGDEGLMRTYGGMEFAYCPICGKSKIDGVLSVKVRDLVNEHGAEAVLAAAGRI